jgi:hypothetical protein
MPFDPSVISTIGPAAMPDIAGAQTKAFKLKDLMQEGQLHALQLKDYQIEQADRAKVKEILSKAGSIDSQTKVNEVTGEIRKINPDMAMAFHHQASQERLVDYETEIQANRVRSEQLNSFWELMGPIADEIKSKGWKPGDSGPMWDLLVQARTKENIPALQNIATQHPELAPHIQQGIAQLGNMTVGKFMDSYENTTAAKEKLDRRLKQSEIDRRAAETAQGQRRVDIEEKKLKFMQQEGLLNDDDARDMAKQYVAGDKSVLQNLGRGAQGARNIIKVRRSIYQEGRAQGLSPEQIAGRIAEFSATVAEERKIGNIAGGVEFASAELNKFIPLALKSSADVPRGSFVPFNKLIQAGQAAISNPALKRLYVNTQGVLNAYDVLAARGGTDMAKREQVRSMLMTADSLQAYAAALDAMKQELEVAKEAGKEAKQRVAGELGGGSPADTSPSAVPPSATGWGKAKVVQ